MAGYGSEERDREGASSLPGLGAALRAPGAYVGRVAGGLRDNLSGVRTAIPAVVLLLAALCLLAVYGYVVSVMARVPAVGELEASRYARATVVYSEDGVQLARYYQQNRTWVPLDSIAPVAVRALIDTEDRRFYEHWGIDVMRTAGAILKTLRGAPQGGSTITMQLVRNAYPEVGEDYVLKRKLEEWYMALQLEQRYSKAEILEIYLNTVPFNYNAFGIEAAARTYFGKSAYRLDTLQAATLVGMLKGTTLYNPVMNPEASRERRNVVLEQMREAGDLSTQEYERLRQRETALDFSPITPEQNRAPYFAEHVRGWLEQWAEGKDYDIYQDGLQVYTTIDADLQRAAEAAVRQELAELQAVVDVAWSRPNMPFVSSDPADYEAYRDQVEPFAYFWEANPQVLPAFIRQTSRFRRLTGEEGLGEAQALERLRQDAAFADSLKRAMTRLQAGFVALDPENGYVRAWVGGRDFEHSKYDHVAQSQRQPGSTFKPFVYAAALEAGFNPNDLLRDVQIEYVDPVTGQRWEPGNFGEETGRLMTLREGLAHSKNTITAQLILGVGPERVADLARRMGIRSELQAVPSLGLGTSVVTLLEMASAYATIADQGRYHEPVFVTRIEDAEGNVLARFQPEARQAVEPAVAYGVLDLMRGVVEEGTGVRIRHQYGAAGDLAGKTGTTQRAADGWFMLIHPELVMGAWVGFPSPAVTFRSRFWGQGSHTALHVVGHFYQAADLPASARFEEPAGYVASPEEGRLLVVQNMNTEDPQLVAQREVRRVRDDQQRVEELNRRELEDRPLGERPPRVRPDAGGQTAEGAGAADEQAEAQPAPEADAETEELNRQARENSQVDEYLERLREEGGNRP